MSEHPVLLGFAERIPSFADEWSEMVGWDTARARVPLASVPRTTSVYLIQKLMHSPADVWMAAFLIDLRMTVETSASLTTFPSYFFSV